MKPACSCKLAVPMLPNTANVVGNELLPDGTPEMLIVPAAVA
jgi:hypothetical protein